MTSAPALTALPLLDGDPATSGPLASGLMTLGLRHAHDPTVVRADDGTYVMFCTDSLGGQRSEPGGPPHPPAGVHVRTSPDLVDWTWAGTALDGVPAEAAAWTGARGLWAPEVVRWPGTAEAGSPARFHLYYSASTFGSNTSAIGLAVAQDLLGPWQDHGVVVRTRAGEQTQNAIDAAVTWDDEGTPWLTYGSFFSGIYTLPLDAETGLPRTPGDLGTCVARRSHSVEAAVEGAFVVHRPGNPAGRYVMLASYDSLFSTYNVRVATSQEITGPYRDRAGHLMTDVDLPPDSVGTPVLVGHQLADSPAWVGPGHCSVLSVPPARAAAAGPGGEDASPAAESPTGDFMVHHVRLAADPTEHTAQLRRVLWTASGWPVVSPQPYAGEPAALPGGLSPDSLGPHPHLAGVWDVLDLRDAAVTGPAGPVTASRLVDLADGDLRTLGAHDVVVHASFDWAAGRETVSFAGYTEEGTAISGTLKSASPRPAS